MSRLVTGSTFRSKLASIYRAAVQALWLLLLLFLPVTSFPPLADRLGNNPVSPLAILPLVLLMTLWLVPRIVRGVRLPPLLGPLLLFAFLALTSSSLALALPLGPYKGQTILARETRALATLALGLGFFACTVLFPRNDREVARSLRWLYAGAILMLTWSTVQGWFVLDGQPGMSLRLNAVHRWFSIRDLVGDRVTGLAYEPSWFADQLVVLYFPLWAASVLGNYSVFPRIGRAVSVELLLALWGLVMFAMTRSRVSFISLGIILTIVLLGIAWTRSGGLSQRISLGGGRLSAVGRMLMRLVLEAAVLGAIIGVLVGATWAFSRVDRRLSQLFTLPERLEGVDVLYPGEEIFHVADRLAFAERVVYWAAGYRVFERYPLMGVGLGNSGFLFEQTLPGYAYSLTEIQALLEPGDLHFPNPKNLWVRLLAETGAFGFAAFSAWLLLMATGAYVLSGRGHGLSRVIGLAGLLGLVSILVEGFSLDSFALPQMWILLGALANAYWREGNFTPIRDGPRIQSLSPVLAP